MATATISETIRKRPPKKKAIVTSSERRSSKVYEPSIESLCDESILAELLQTPVPWKYKDLYASQSQAPTIANNKKQAPVETQIWKMAGLLDRVSSREGDTSASSTGRSTGRSSSVSSSRLASTARTSMISSVRSGTPKEPITVDVPVQQVKQRTGPPPERYVVAHMLNYRRFIKDERWWETHGLDLPLGGNDKRKLMVLRYGMRVPFAVETVFRWFEEIMTTLRSRAEKLIKESPWRSWAVPALVVLLREFAWSSPKQQQLIQEMQAKGLTSLCILAHRWRLRVVEEQEWRPASRVLVVDSVSQVAASGACPPPRDQAIDDLRIETNQIPSPLPYTSGADWSALGPDEAASPSKHLEALHELSLRHNSRANGRMGRDVSMTNKARSVIHGGPGTGREAFQVPPSAPSIGVQVKLDTQEGTTKLDLASTAHATPSASATATDHLLAKMNKRETARAAYMKEVPALEQHTPHTHTTANKVAFQASPHSFDEDSDLALNKSDSVIKGTLFSPLVGQRAGTVGGGFGVGDGGGAEGEGGTDWYLFHDDRPVSDSDSISQASRVSAVELPFPNFFPTDDLTGDGLRLRANGSPSAAVSAGVSMASQSSSSIIQRRKSNRRRRSSVASISVEPANDESIVSSLELNDLKNEWSPIPSPLQTPKGSLAQTLLSPNFNEETGRQLTQLMLEASSPLRTNEVTQFDETIQVETSTPPTSALFAASDIAELSNTLNHPKHTKARFEPKHYIASNGGCSRRVSATESGLAAEFEPANADRKSVQYLLDACAEGNIDNAAEMFKTVGPSCLVHWVDGRGRGALHYAAINGHVELCQWLLSNGALPMAKDEDGRVPLHLAALSGHENALRALMNHPAARPKRPDPVDNFNRTPLHLAAWFGQKHTTEALLRNAANVNAKDVQGYTPLERASMGRRTALLEFLQRQQILPLDFNTTFQVYHTYDEHAEVNRKKIEERAVRRREKEKTKAIRDEIAARAVRSVELFHQSGVVPSLGPISSVAEMSSEFNHSNQSKAFHDKDQYETTQKRRRRPAPLPDINSRSAYTHPTAVVGGLDELLTDSLNFPFPRAVHLRNRRDRLPSDSDSDSDNMTRDGGTLDSDDKNECDSIASDDYDMDGYLSETATSLEDHAVAVARAGGNIDGVEQIKVHVPGTGSVAELKSAELISKHVNEYLGGPQVAGVGAEVRILFAATPVPAASFSRGKARSPGFVHTIPSPTVDPGDITGGKARTRLRLLGGKHRSLMSLESTQVITEEPVEQRNDEVEASKGEATLIAAVEMKEARSGRTTPTSPKAAHLMPLQI